MSPPIVRFLSLRPVTGTEMVSSTALGARLISLTPTTEPGMATTIQLWRTTMSTVVASVYQLMAMTPVTPKRAVSTKKVKRTQDATPTLRRDPCMSKSPWAKVHATRSSHEVGRMSVAGIEI